MGILQVTGRKARPQNMLGNYAFLESLTRQFSSGLQPSPALKQLSATSTLLRNLDNGAEVREMISLVKPQTVFLELCQNRLRKLRNNDQPTNFLQDMFSQLRLGNMNLPEQLVKASLSGVYGVMRMMGMDPGVEFKAALEEADRLRLEVVCGDRDVDVTARKLSENFSLGDIMKMAMSGNVPSEMMETLQSGEEGGLEQRVEAMKTRKSAQQMSQLLRNMNPALAAVLIDERDEIMVQNLRNLKGRVVGVVGLAHLDGIERLWREMQEGAS